MRAFPIFAVIAGALVAAPPAVAQEAPPQGFSIEWELRFPFRMFSDLTHSKRFPDFSEADKVLLGSDWSFRRDLFHDQICARDDGPIVCSELSRGPTRVARMREVLSRRLTKKSDSNPNVSDIFIEAGARYYLAQRAHYTRYMSLEKGRSSVIGLVVGADARKSYADRHKAYFRLAGPVESGWTCQWNTEDCVTPSPTKRTTCSVSYRAQIRRTDDPALTSSVCVAVFESDAAVEPKFRLRIAGADTLVHERVIVGIGDSFASGEGNPDVPARLVIEPGSKLGSWPARPQAGAVDGGKAGKDNRRAAYWLDRNCHRSMLGSQFRAALQYAAENPKIETAFIGVACSGAEIYKGILGPYGGTEETSKITRKNREAGSETGPLGRWRSDMSQINQVLWALCEEDFDEDLSLHEDFKKSFNAEPDKALLPCAKLKRPIDAVLVSIGGNDVDFAKVVVWALGYKNPLIPKTTVDEALENIKAGRADDVGPKRASLADKYKALLQVIADRLGVPKDRVIASAYPDMTSDADGRRCGASEAKKCVWKGFTRTLRGASCVATDRLDAVSIRLMPAINEAIESAGWIVAKSHLSKFQERGFCAERKLGGEDDPSLFAYRSGGQPYTFNPYANTTRWFRTVDDTMMVQNTLPTDDDSRTVKQSSFAMQFLSRKSISSLYENYGALHPNALGAAATADAYLVEMRKVLKTPRTPADGGEAAAN